MWCFCKMVNIYLLSVWWWMCAADKSEYSAFKSEPFFLLNLGYSGRGFPNWGGIEMTGLIPLLTSYVNVGRLFLSHEDPDRLLAYQLL